MDSPLSALTENKGEVSGVRSRWDHIGQKLRFVNSRECQLPRLLREPKRACSTGHSCLDLGILLRQQFRLGGELLVGLLKSPWRDCKRDRQPLRVLEQKPSVRIVDSISGRPEPILAVSVPGRQG